VSDLPCDGRHLIGGFLQALSRPPELVTHRPQDFVDDEFGDIDSDLADVRHFDQSPGIPAKAVRRSFSEGEPCIHS
jgi:hypothetical protein